MASYPPSPQTKNKQKTKQKTTTTTTPTPFFLLDSHTILYYKLFPSMLLMLFFFFLTPLNEKSGITSEKA